MDRARHAGFTLVELLVAVALFAVVAGLAWGGLDALSRSSVQLDEAGARLGAVQRGLDLLVRDLRQAVPRGVRDGGGRQLPALAGEGRSVELTRAGLGNALAQPRAELERVAWRRRDAVLERLHWPVLDRAGATQPVAEGLLEGVASLQLRYFDEHGRSHAEWPPPRSAGTALPRAVEVRLTLDDLGELRRVAELTAATP